MGVAESNKRRERAKAIARPIPGDRQLAEVARGWLGWLSDNEADFITISDASEKTGISHTTVTRLVDGDKSVKADTLQRFAEGMGEDPTPLLVAAGYISPDSLALLGAKIRSRREWHGLTQEELADKLSVDVKSVNEWEHGLSAPSDDHINVLSGVLRTPASWFFLDHFDESEKTDVVINFSPRLASWIRGGKWHPTQRIDEDDDGSITLRMSLSGSLDELHSWILQFGPDVEVISPHVLRNTIGEIALRVSSVYNDNIRELFRLLNKPPFVSTTGPNYGNSIVDPRDLDRALQAGLSHEVVIHIGQEAVRKLSVIGFPQLGWTKEPNAIVLPIDPLLWEDGGITLRTYIGNYRRLLAWAMHFGQDLDIQQPEDLAAEFEKVLNEIDARWKPIDSFLDLSRFRLHERLAKLDIDREAIEIGIEHWSRIMAVNTNEKNNNNDVFGEYEAIRRRAWASAVKRYVTQYNLKDSDVLAMDLRLQAQLDNLCIAYDIDVKGGMPSDEAAADIIMGKAIDAMSLQDQIIDWELELRKIESLHADERSNLGISKYVPLFPDNEVILNLFEKPTWLRWASGDNTLDLDFSNESANLDEEKEADFPRGKSGDAPAPQSSAENIPQGIVEAPTGKGKTVAARQFLYQHAGRIRRLRDPDPKLSPDEVRLRYAAKYAELVTADVKRLDPGPAGEERYEFVPRFGTRG